MFCCTLLYVHSSIAIILIGKRELVALLNLSSWCLVMVEQLFHRGVTGLFAVCDCGISLSYKLFFTIQMFQCRMKNYDICIQYNVLFQQHLF